MFRLILFITLCLGTHQKATLQERALQERALQERGGGMAQDTLGRGMDELVITGSMRPVKKLECPVVVEVYSQQFFRKNPVPSIFEALQLVNGVRPQLNCNVCNTGDIHINGLDGPYTMVTIDGMPIVSGLSTVYGLFGIPNQMIDRVEIVKGPASGLYGSEAVGGLINIITKSPSGAPAFSADVMATGWKEFQADASVKWKTGRKVQALTGLHMYHYGNPVDQNLDNFTDMALQKRISVFSKWSMERPGSKVASTGIRYFHEDRWGGEMNWTSGDRGGDRVYGESIYTRRFEWIGQYSLPMTLPLTFSWSYNYHDQDSYYGIKPFMARQHIGFGQLTWQGRVRDHKLLAGMAMRYTKMDDNTPATLGRVRGTWLPGVFLQDEFTLSERHELMAGLRYDHHPAHGGILTPRLAWKWKTGGSGVFRLNAGTGFRVVNIFTEDHAALTGAREVVIPETLDPERSYNINLNYGYRLPLGHAVLALDASAWYTRFANRIMPDYDTDPDRIFYRNLDGHSVSRGLSLNLTYDWRNKVRLLAGATLQDVYLQERRGDKYERIRPVLTENWSAVWTLTYNTPVKGLAIDYTGSLYGPMRLPLAGKMDPRPPYSPVWALQNLQLTYNAGTLAFYGGVKNLLNWTPMRSAGFLIARSHDPFDRDVQYDAGGNVLATPDNPYALSFDPTYMYAPNQGRRVFLGVRMTLK
jgi:outer membrane receptor for ferrienterochelin and colicins